MSKFQEKYRSESKRWQFWDYSSPGVYFITVATNNREKILGKKTGNKIILTESGHIAKNHILQINDFQQNVILDEFVIMPDHFHLLIIITDDEFEYPKQNYPIKNEFELMQYVDTIRGDTIRGDTIHELYLRGFEYSKSVNNKYKFTAPLTKQQKSDYIKLRRKMLIPKIMGKMKMQISKEINILNNTPKFKNLQSDYYEKIIRTTKDFFTTKKYIRENPAG